MVPIEHFNLYLASFNLMPDNGDVLPIDRIEGFIVTPCSITDAKLSKKENEVVIPRECYLVKCILTSDTIMHIKTQTTEFMSLEAYENIKKDYPEAAKIIVKEALDNLSMNTVKDLMINNMYAGRTLEEARSIWSEINQTVQDIYIFPYGE